MTCGRRCKIWVLSLFVTLTCFAQSDLLTHTVKKGETLYAIAGMYQTTVAELQANNPGSANGIREGAVLRIPQQLQSSGQPRYHTIQSGETLYRLTQIYGVDVQALCDTNPGLSAENFKIGQTIVIPSHAVKSAETTSESLSDLAGKSQCREMHKVKRKETVYGIARMYEISEAELIAANKELADPEYKLKKGHFLCIPYPAVKKSEEVEFPQKKSVERKSQVSVAVILPLEKGDESARMIEFYRGFLMAVDSLKNGGVSINVLALESGSSVADIQTVVNNPALKEVDLIFGPLHADQTAVLGRFAREHKIKLVLPFSNRSPEVFGNPQLYLVNAPRSYQFGEVKELFYNKFSAHNIIIVDTFEEDAAKTGFATELGQYLTEKKVNYMTVTTNSSQAQLSAAFSTMRPNVVVSNSSSLPSLNRLMAQLKEFKAANGHYAISLFGYPEWQVYSKTQASNFHAMDTYIYTSFFAPPTHWRTRSFEDKFTRNFGCTMLATYPRFAMLGFDVGYYFIKGVATYGAAFDQNLPTFRVSPLQNSLDFQRVSNWGGFVNRKISFIHYRGDQTIDVIDFSK